MHGMHQKRETQIVQTFRPQANLYGLNPDTNSEYLKLLKQLLYEIIVMEPMLNGFTTGITKITNIFFEIQWNWCELHYLTS